MFLVGKRLGYRHAPPVNHTAGWRDSATGYHSNDVESENNRIKAWLRKRYSKVRLDVTTAPEEDSVPGEEFALDLYEYGYYVNVGESMDNVFHGLRSAAGARAPAVLFL